MIQGYLKQILASRYGRDMRDPIYKALDDIYKTSPIKEGTDHGLADEVNGIKEEIDALAPNISHEYFQKDEPISVHSNKIGYFQVNARPGTTFGFQGIFKVYMPLGKKSKVTKSYTWSPSSDHPIVNGTFRAFKMYESRNNKDVDSTSLGIGRELNVDSVQVFEDSKMALVQFSLANSSDEPFDDDCVYCLHSKDNASIIVIATDSY